MKTQEVAVLLNRSGEQIRRYVVSGELHATKNGRDLIFDRDEVIAFAKKRGIHIQQEVTAFPDIALAEKASEAIQGWAAIGAPLKPFLARYLAGDKEGVSQDSPLLHGSLGIMSLR